MGRPRDQKLLNEIAVRIKKMRQTKNITLEAFYNDTGIHLARIEASKGNITVSTLKKICHYFDITLEEFFRDM
jgi:transcriptional regulator with XRE-family HTH domain